MDEQAKGQVIRQIDRATDSDTIERTVRVYTSNNPKQEKNKREFSTLSEQVICRRFGPVHCTIDENLDYSMKTRKKIKLTYQNIMGC